MDLRKAKKTDKEAIRILAIKMYNKGISQKEISLYFGVRTNTISDWVKLYKQYSKGGLKEVKKWAEESKDKIALFFLPSYSPELNPDE